MKVLLVGMNKLRFMPYAMYYLNAALDVSGIEVHIALWDRDGKPDIEAPQTAVLHYYTDIVDDSQSLTHKLSHIFGYRSFLNGLDEELHPDKLIVMHTTAAMLLYGKLLGEYKHRYAFDYRDVTYERFGFYRHMLGKVCMNSACAFTSSDGFRRYFPENCQIYTTHNITLGVDASALRTRANSELVSPIKISFWGRVRHAEVNKAIIQALGGDKRFELHYYGLMQGEIKEVVERAQAQYDNIFAHGEYCAAQTAEFAGTTDLIHNLYDMSDPTIPFAMGNKYYDALLYGIPQLCTAGSYMGDRVKELGIGYSCDPFSDKFADEVFGYWKSIDWMIFDSARKKELGRVTKETLRAKTALINWLSSR